MYKSIEIYQATSGDGKAVGIPTMVKTTANATAKDHGGRVHIFTEGCLTGYY